MIRYDNDIKLAITELEYKDICHRFWKKDFTIWKPEPMEITNRLGWLTVTEIMQERIPELQLFAREIIDAGYRFIVLLGMGGSSLSAEVFKQVFGSSPGCPELIVLDSTIPGTIRAVADAIAPAQTLFLVSSKSGTTTEPMLLYRFFRNTVEQTVGKGKAGQNFAAITDSATPLAMLARGEGFRKIFLNPGDIGGRYSVLSYFGLVPAALLGIDIRTLLLRANDMMERCSSCTDIYNNNPGFRLGTVMGLLAQRGRNKLTLITSPSIGSLSLWIEQLVAESTGKEKKGIIPVADEPLALPEYYGDDRLFVYLHLKDDDNGVTDKFVRDIEVAGQPVLVLEMKDKLDMGAEFFRWEFATALAGSILGIHPFNQPNVQSAKDNTERILREYADTKKYPELVTTSSLTGLLSNATPDKYLAIMAYLHETPQIDKALTALRKRVLEHYHMATTLGYGPRFLHSTGQLHKGGPDTGLFFQITTAHQDDIPIPEVPYTFGTVADAQAAGDLQALQAAGRQIASIRLPKDDPVRLNELVNEI